MWDWLNWIPLEYRGHAVAGAIGAIGTVFGKEKFNYVLPGISDF